MIVWINNPFDNLPIEGFRPQRYWLMAQAFAREGHEVVLWTSDWSHSLKRRRAMTDDQLAAAGRQLGPDARLILIPSIPYRSHVSFARIRSHRNYAKKWFSEGVRLVTKGLLSKPDLVIASTPPMTCGIVAQAFRRHWDCKVIVDIQDTWPETFYRTLPLPKRLQQKWGPFFFAPLRRFAKRLYTGADAVTGVARRYLSLAREYGVTAPTRLCYHGISLPPNFAGAGPAAKMLPFNGQRNISLMYLGNMGRSYDLATVIRGVRETPGVELHLAGGGPDEADLRIEAKSCPRIFFHGYLRDSAVRALMQSADVGVIPMFDESCVGVPYKLADYAVAALPVINSLGGETAQLIANYKAGVKYTAGNLASFKKALGEIASNTARLPEMRRNILAMARGEFDAVPIYDSYVEFAMSLFPPPQPDGKPEPEEE